MGNFSEATAVEQTGPGEFKAVLDAQWAVGEKLHGGYLLAVVARAAGEVAKHPHLTAISGAFPAAPLPGEATVQVTELKSGRSQTQLRASLVQDGQVCVEALVTQGTVVEDDPWWSSVEPPEMPAEQDCPLTPAEPPGAGFRVPLLDVVESRMDPASMAMSKTGVIGTWQRLTNGDDWDPLSLLVALDGVPPITFELGVFGWVPTLQMSAYIRRLPAPGSVKVRMHANDITGNRMDETALVWDSKDRLVGQATQFAAVRIPKPPANR